MKTLGILVLLLVAPPLCAQDAYSLIDSFYARFEPVPGQALDQDAMAEFLKQTESMAAQNPDSLEYRTATAVVRAAWGRERGVRGLGALKQAREELESVIAVDPDAMGGFAMAVLARLYATVPGRPLGFGDVDHAMELFGQVQARFPDSQPVAYYLGLTYLDHDQAALGRELLSRVESLPPYCDCEAWTAFLRRASSDALTGPGKHD